MKRAKATPREGIIWSSKVCSQRKTTKGGGGSNAHYSFNVLESRKIQDDLLCKGISSHFIS